MTAAEVTGCAFRFVLMGEQNYPFEREAESREGGEGWISGWLREAAIDPETTVRVSFAREYMRWREKIWRMCRTIEPKNFTAKTAKVAKNRQRSSSQRSLRIEIFRGASPSTSVSAL